MAIKYADIIIIGSGISGLYSALTIKNISPDTSFLVLEKYKKKWIGGRTSNDTFYGTEIVTGAGIGRKNKDKLLHKLLDTFNFDTNYFNITHNYSSLINNINNNRIVDTMKLLNILIKEYKEYKNKNHTFKQFATNILGEKLYKDFILTTGYSDYENEDILETLYYYDMEDNTCCWKAFRVPWQKLVLELYNYIGEKHFKFSNKVINITKITEDARASFDANVRCKANYIIKTESGINYLCNKVILASTIDTIRTLLPNKPIYNDIEGQPFLLLYAKFTKSSIPILKQYVSTYTILPGPLQKMIPINPDNGIYLIAYNDNNNALALKNNLKNTKENRDFYQTLLEKSLGIPNDSLHIIALKDYYWKIGTHYYKPLNKELYSSRESFIEKAQHPENNFLVVGEVVSRKQGWTEGALESVKAVVNKKWIEN
jgi:hypothetical protein